MDYKAYTYIPKKINRKIATKKCSVCGKIKALRLFYYNHVRKEYMSNCKECGDKKSKAYYKKNITNPQTIFQLRSTEIYRKCRIKKLPCVKKLLGRYLLKLWNESNQICYYTGRKMDLKGYPKNPNAVTVDRVDPKKGYVEGNIVLCTSIANRMKQDLSYKDLFALCKEILRHRK